MDVTQVYHVPATYLMHNREKPGSRHGVNANALVFKCIFKYFSKVFAFAFETKNQILFKYFQRYFANTIAAFSFFLQNIQFKLFLSLLSILCIGEPNLTFFMSIFIKVKSK